jgi:plasmid stabilization system protein ParE
MTLPLVLRKEAEADLKSARQWYENQREGLGDEFIDAIDAVLSRVEAMPELFAVALKGVRRVKARRFPYVVYYRIQPHRVEVLAVLHGKRNPKVWQDRA